MTLFTRNKDTAIRAFILKVVNNNCHELSCRKEGPRAENRTRLAVVAYVVPLEDGSLRIDEAFTAVTKEFSTTGVSLVLAKPWGFEEVFLGFRWEKDMIWVRAKSRYVHPIGGGFCQIGLRLTEMVSGGDFPELASLVI